MVKADANLQVFTDSYLNFLPYVRENKINTDRTGSLFEDQKRSDNCCSVKTKLQQPDNQTQLK